MNSSKQLVFTKEENNKEEMTLQKVGIGQETEIYYFKFQTKFDRNPCFRQ